MRPKTAPPPDSPSGRSGIQRLYLEKILPLLTRRQNPGPLWRVVIGYPFDPEGHSLADQRARLERFEGATRTLVWLPAPFTEGVRRELGQLVLLDYLLKGEVFDRHAGHLAPIDRPVARQLLEGQRETLRVRLAGARAPALDRAALANENATMLPKVLQEGRPPHTTGSTSE